MKATGLTKRYAALTAVDGVDFTIERQTCFAFLGPNGAGKSSLIRMISCLSPVSAGTLTVLGMQASPGSRALKARLGIVSQDDNLDFDLTVSQNLLIHGLYFSMRRPVIGERSEQLLDFFGLAGKGSSQVKELSGGMRRRLAIARGLLHNPDLLILDEPTTGLDPQARLLVWERLAGLKDQGVTLILTTHFMEEAAALADQILVIDHGRVITQGAPGELIEGIGQKAIELHDLSDPALTALQATGLVRHADRHGNRVLLYVADDQPVLDHLRKEGLLGGRFAVRPANLEDVFLTLTGRELRD